MLSSAIHPKYTLCNLRPLHKVGRRGLVSVTECDCCGKSGVAVGCRKLMLYLKALSSESIFIYIHIYVLLRPSSILWRRKPNPKLKFNSRSLRRLLLLVA